MKHPFESLKDEYTQLMRLMVVRTECRQRIDEVATKILGYRRNFEAVRVITGVPVVFAGPSFYREASLDFNLSPAQGDSWRKVSVHVPRGRGPFPSWSAAAIDAYRIDGLDKVGADKWTWELVCFYGELFNGFGYRDFHRMHSPYLWGGTNIQMLGKYTNDGHFDSEHMDEQLGIVPIAKRLAQLAPDLELVPGAGVIPPPAVSGLGGAVVGLPADRITWLQTSLKTLGFEIEVDGSYGRETRRAVAAFEHAYGLKEDGGYAGPEVHGAIELALAQMVIASP